jgi:hypothetical protein
MAEYDTKPPARPLFRKLALGVAVVCFLLGIVFALTPVLEESKWVCVIIVFFVGIVTLTIAKTGFWPRPK